MRNTLEFEELQLFFEKLIKKEVFGVSNLNREKKTKKIPRNCFYENGKINELFLFFMHGYALHKSLNIY